jgi:hypothetical protein
MLMIMSTADSRRDISLQFGIFFIHSYSTARVVKEIIHVGVLWLWITLLANFRAIKFLGVGVGVGVGVGGWVGGWVGVWVG